MAKKLKIWRNAGKQTASKRQKPMLYRRQLKSKFIISGSDYNNNTQITQNKYSENSDKKQ